MSVLFTNNALTTIASSISSSATSIPLASGTGVLFPSLSAGQTFIGQLTQGNSTEIVQVTARTVDTLTVVRGFEGTTPTAFTIGSVFSIVVSAGGLNSYAPAFGASYVDTTVTRSLAVSYTNNTGRTLFVSVITNVTSSGVLSGLVSGVAIVSETKAVGTANISFLVPPLLAYSTTATGTQTLTKWYEM